MAVEADTAAEPHEEPRSITVAEAAEPSSQEATSRRDRLRCIAARPSCEEARRSLAILVTTVLTTRLVTTVLTTRIARTTRSVRM